MPVSHVSKWYAVQDAQVAPLLTDPVDTIPTFGTLVDVPGIKSLTFTGDVESKELRGDNTLLDTESVLTTMTFSMEYAKLSLDALAIMAGGTVTDSTTPPAAAWDYDNDESFPYFLLMGRSPTADTVGGDVWLMLYKCKLTSFPEIGFAEEDYQTFTVEGSIAPLASTHQWIGIRYNEDAGGLELPTFQDVPEGTGMATIDQKVPAWTVGP